MVALEDLKQRNKSLNEKKLRVGKLLNFHIFLNHITVKNCKQYKIKK